LEDIGSMVYLLRIVNDDKSLYKIGFTSESVYDRIRNIQTGCPYEIRLIDTYKSEYSRKIERTLHNMFSHKQTFGEWFELDCIDEFNFKELCEHCEENFKTIELIKNNHSD